jgi:hypothetical protein
MATRPDFRVDFFADDLDSAAPRVMSILSSLLSLTLFTRFEPVSLSWQAPSECMDREQAIVRLRELSPDLHEQLPQDNGQIAVAVEVTDTTARLRFVSPRGVDERTIEAANCEALAEAVLLVVAVAVEAAQAEVLEPEPEPEETEPEPEPEPEFELEPAPPPKPEPRVHGHLGVLGGGGYGPIDAGMGTVALELGVHGRWWRASVRGLFVPPRVTTGRYDAGFGGLRACVVPPLARGRIELPVCAGIEAGVVRGRGLDTSPNPRTATLPWAAADLGPALLWVPNRLVALGVEVDLVVALLRGGFTVGGEIAQSFPPVGARALAHVEVRFP